MALSPADFYAYSRATGAPVPEDPRERAEMAPEVLEFRRNQLRAPQQEEEGGFNLTNLLGIGAAAAGLAGGTFGLVRALRKEPAKTAAAPLPKGYGASVENFVSEEGRSSKENLAKQGFAQVSTDVAPSSVPPAPQTPTQAPAAPKQNKVDFVSKYILSKLAGKKEESQLTPRSYAESTGALQTPEDLTSLQQEIGSQVPEQAIDALDSGVGQEEHRIDVKIQRHTGYDVPDVDIPQEEVVVDAFGLLPPAQRTLTRQEKEAKIFARLETENLQLGKTTHSATNPFGPEGPRIPPGPLLYPSQMPDVIGYGSEQQQKGKILAGVSSPTREFMSAFAQNDPRVQDVVRRENVVGFEQLKTFGGLKGAGLLNADSFDPITGEMISRGEQISGMGQMRQELNPAWTEGFKNYWERRATELPHTMDDYEARKAANKLNYQLPAELQTANNNAQVYEKWDKQTSEALQEIYAETVGDIPQYVTVYKEPKTGILGEASVYRGKAGTTSEASSAPVPVLNPKKVVFGAQSKSGPFVSVGETSLSRLARDPSFASGNVLRFKGEGSSTMLDVMPLSYDTEADVNLPSSSGNFIKGKAKVTRTALVPLQKAVTVKDEVTGKDAVRLVNFSIDLTAPVGVRKNIDETGRENVQSVTLQEAVRNLKDFHGKDYAALNEDVNKLLLSTHSAYNVPVMTRVPFDKYDEARNEFIRMLSGSQYEGKEYGFLTSVEGQKLPYTGPASPASGGNRAENIIQARQMLSQAGVPLKNISDYLPEVDSVSPSPKVLTTSTRDVGIPKPDVMSTGTDLGVSTSTYERISPRLGGALTSQLRTLINQGAAVENIDGNVVYSTDKGKVSYPEQRLVETLKNENQDVFTISNLIGRPLSSKEGVIAGPYQTLASQKRAEQSKALPQKKSDSVGFSYEGATERVPQPIGTSFTGAARYASGPAYDVLTPNYPRGEGRVKLPKISGQQEVERSLFTSVASQTPGGRVVRGALQLGGGLGAIAAGLGTEGANLSESETISRYGASGSQLQDLGNRLMAEAAYKKGLQPNPTAFNQMNPERNIPTAVPAERLYGPQAPSEQGPRRPDVGLEQNTEMAGYARRPSVIKEAIDPVQARNDAVARHIGNYISAASQRMEGPASIQGVKLKGTGQNALRAYQAPSEGMIQQLMRAALRR
jgi:hypothetical protein